MTDDDLRAKWRDAGGSFHGPNVETGTMPESKLLPFLRGLMPDGYVLVPLRATRAMERVFYEEDWQWEDLLEAAGAVTEEQYSEAAKPAMSHLDQAIKELRALTPEELRAELKKHENSDIAVALRQLNQPDCPTCQGSGEDPEGSLDSGGPEIDPRELGHLYFGAP